jgi:hypothetical protein
MPVILATWEVEIRSMAVQGVPGQKVLETPISTNGCLWWCTCHPSYEGSINSIVVQGCLGMKGRPYLKNKQCKKDWGCGSSGRAPSWPVQGLEFKLQYHQKKKFLHPLQMYAYIFVNYINDYFILYIYEIYTNKF